MIQYRMVKSKAIELLGGTVASAAAAVGVTYQAVDKWPDPLPARIEDRVLAVLARRHLSAEVLGTTVSDAAERTA